MTAKYIEWTPEITEALHNGVVEVEFEKKDGTVRRMLATLKSASIPSEKTPKGVKEYNRTILARVFDTEKQDWRTITKGRLLSWKVA